MNFHYTDHRPWYGEEKLLRVPLIDYPCFLKVFVNSVRLQALFTYKYVTTYPAKNLSTNETCRSCHTFPRKLLTVIDCQIYSFFKQETNIILYCFNTVIFKQSIYLNTRSKPTFHMKTAWRLIRTQADWHSDHTFINFERHWITLKIEADEKYSRRQWFWRAKG